MRVNPIIIFFILFACARPNGDDLFYPAQGMGKVSSKLKEASGLVASIKNPGKLWSLNDSGNDAEVFLIDEHGKIAATYKLKHLENRDWEEISIGPGPDPDLNYIYVGDIGDNDSEYSEKHIYRFPEPALSDMKDVSIKDFDTLTFKFPEGPRDSEAMLADPISKDLFIVSKREDSVTVYRAHYPFAEGTITMENTGKIPYRYIVGGSVSPDGTEILLKTYNKLYYWHREKNEDIAKVLKREPKRLSYEPEHQGEAVAWATDHSGFYTLSESSVADRAQLIFYRRKVK